MDRFSELVAKGVAAFNYTPIAPSIPEQCPICRSYNNIFSIATDTHMSCLDDGTKIITGHIISDKKKFDSFIYSCQYMGVNFHNAGVCSFADWMMKMGLKGAYSIVNNDAVYILKSIENNEDDDQGTLMKSPDAMMSFTTDESSIPQAGRFITKDNNNDSIRECIKSTYEETAQAMNESRYIHGNQWCVAELSDGPHIVGIVNGKSIKF